MRRAKRDAIFRLGKRNSEGHDWQRAFDFNLIIDCDRRLIDS